MLYVKKNGKKTFVITDAGMNDLIRPALYQAYHEIVPVTPRPGRKRVVDVVGPVCETGDFFARDRLLPEIAVRGTWWLSSMPEPMGARWLQLQLAPATGGGVD